MTAVRFTKMEGLGNDFIVVDQLPGLMTPAAARRLCDRRHGIGADGVLSLLPPRDPSAARRLHIYNADGSVAEMCGNGLRCVVRFLEGVTGPIRFDTDAGPRTGERLADGRVEADLAEATLIGDGLSAPLGDRPWQGTGISMGNPHLVLDPFPPGTDLLALATAHGPALERHPAFPGRVNVGFVSVSSPHEAQLVVFERGSGITLACGTGAGAAAVALVRAGRARGPLVLALPGGRLEVEIEGDPTCSGGPGVGLGTVRQRGLAGPVFQGEVELSAQEWLSE